MYCDPTTGTETREYANGTTEAQELWTPSYITSDGICECIVDSDEYMSSEVDAYGGQLPVIYFTMRLQVLHFVMETEWLDVVFVARVEGH